MSRVKHHTSNALKEYLAENFSGKKFCVLDLRVFADERGIPFKSITYSCWWLCHTGFIVKCGERARLEGGNPFNIYELAERVTDDFECVDIRTASANLSVIFGYNV